MHSTDDIGDEIPQEPSCDILARLREAGNALDAAEFDGTIPDLQKFLYPFRVAWGDSHRALIDYIIARTLYVRALRIPPADLKEATYNVQRAASVFAFTEQHGRLEGLRMTANTWVSLCVARDDLHEMQRRPKTIKELKRNKRAHNKREREYWRTRLSSDNGVPL